MEPTKTPMPQRLAALQQPFSDNFDDLTILGTPIPVAHSTISKPANYNTYLVSNNCDLRKSPFKHESPTLSEHKNLLHKVEENSILNINSMQGLSGSVLENDLATNHVQKFPRVKSDISPEPEVERMLSVEEQEAENRRVQIDQAELRLLEDAFSDLGTLNSEVDEYTAPTKACATLSHAANMNHSGLEPNQSANGDTGTAVSSLSSTVESIKFSSEEDKKVLNGNSGDVAISSSVKLQLGTNVEVASAPKDLTLRSVDASCKPIRSVAASNAPSRSFRAPVDLDETVEADKENNSKAVSLPVHSKAETVVDELTSDMNNYSRHAISRYEKTRAIDPSVQDISCLHLSDIDCLLERVRHEKHEDPESMDPISNAKFTSIDPREVAKHRTIRRLSSRPSLSSAERPRTPLANISSQINPTLPGCTTSSSVQVSGHPGSPLPITENSAPSSVNNQHSAVTCTTNQMSNTSNQTGSQIHSPLLSNTNCLIFCGAVCGQTQRQQLLIKHHLAKPINVRLTVSTGSDVFKLADEKGYLFADAQNICLPPDLEYTVHVAYAARYPLSWDTGCLQLSTDGPHHSAWKVRLIGYTNNAQLECSCCTQLSSDVYWTKAFKVPSPPKLQRDSGTSPVSKNFGEAVASVILTNYGTRAAWVYGVAEPLSNGRPQHSLDNARVMVTPNCLVVGPNQSQNIMVSLQSGLLAARVLFFYGDEVIRHQVRLHYTVADKSDLLTDKKRSRFRLRVCDLMKDFANETRFQTVEMPSPSHAIRPKDWHQALSQQLRAREHLILNVYTSDEGSDNQNLGQRSPSPNLSSICVKQDAFSASIREPTHTSKLRETLSLHENSANASHTNRLRLDPPECLCLVKSANEPFVQGKFSLCLTNTEEDLSNEYYRVVCSIRPLTKVLQYDSTQNTYRPIGRSADDQTIFRFCAQPQNSELLRYGDRWRVWGSVSPWEPLSIAFEFRSTDSGLFRQEWHVLVSNQPNSLRRSFEPAEKSPATISSHSFTITLEGRCDLPVLPQRKSLPSISPGTPQALGLSHLSPRNTDRPRRYKLGLLHISGIPVTFDPVNSDSNELTKSAQLELFNSSKEHTVLVHLDLPKPPFHVTRPMQTRFRILPSRLVRLTLKFQPVEIGRSESQLKITVAVFPAPIATENASSPIEIRPCKAAIPLFGEML